MKVIVYVEGKSDKLSMEVLLKGLIEQKRTEGITITFFETTAGDRKKTLLTKIPIKAANILLNDPETWVVVTPDLYPPNKGFAHATFDELKEGVQRNFDNALADKGISDDRLKGRFHVFCFKHDLEALILASPEALKRHISASTISVSWTVPVEDQDQGNPPKKIVEAVFSQLGKKYVDTVDAPRILESVDYLNAAAGCPQCFKPFVEHLAGLRAIC